MADNDGTPADPTDDILTEVALNPAEVAAAQTDINIVPTPDTSRSPAGPDWIQIGSEGGFLPAPTVVTAAAHDVDHRPDPLRRRQRRQALAAAGPGRARRRRRRLLEVRRQDPHPLQRRARGLPGPRRALRLLHGRPRHGRRRRPARLRPEHADRHAGQRRGRPAGRGFNLTALNNAFKHHADGSGVFESSQDPIIVGQAAYNCAYGKTFAASGDCTNPNGTNKCDGMARINQQGGDDFRFDTLRVDRS